MSRETTYYEESEDEGEFVPNLVFVIMSFHTDMDDTYKTIKEECGKLGLDPKRADELPGSGLINQEVIELIEDAEFIICDLTHERPNVYYELGYAHGIGNERLEILLIAKEKTNIHFDIAPMRVQYYKDIDHLRELLAKHLKAMINLTRN
jgi:hypothetical protein